MKKQNLPVFDATIQGQRGIVNRIIKEQNKMKGSKFMKPSYSAWGKSYN